MVFQRCWFECGGPCEAHVEDWEQSYFGALPFPSPAKGQPVYEFGQGIEAIQVCIELKNFLQKHVHRSQDGLSRARVDTPEFAPATSSF